MRWFSSKKLSLLALCAMAAGLVMAGSRLASAWQITRPTRGIDDIDSQEQPKRGVGSLQLSKCQVSLIDNVVLAADRPGVIAFVEPEEGDSVKANTHIVGLKDEIALALLKVAKQKAENDVHIKFGKASAAVAKVEWEKNLDANRRVANAVPIIEVKRSELAYEKALLQTEQAEHEQIIARYEVEKAEEELKSFRVEAPFDGQVRRILKRKGEAVRQGDPILELVSTRRVKVEGYLPFEDVANVAPGDTVRVQIDIPGRELEIENEVFEGKVIFVDPTVSKVTQGARVWAEVQNRGERLIEGLYAKMTIMHGRGPGAGKSNTAKSIKPSIQQTGGIK